MNTDEKLKYGYCGYCGWGIFCKGFFEERDDFRCVWCDGKEPIEEKVDGYSSQ